jgi:phasin family protein
VSDKNPVSTAAMEGAMRLAQIAMNHAKKVMELQIEVTQAILAESAANAQALAGARDPQSMLTLRANQAQATAQRFMSYAQKVGDLAMSMQSEYAKVFSDQMSGTSRDFLANLQKMGSGAPGAQQVMSTLQSMMSNVNSTLQQMGKAFGGMGVPMPSMMGFPPPSSQPAAAPEVPAPAPRKRAAGGAKAGGRRKR